MSESSPRLKPKKSSYYPDLKAEQNSLLEITYPYLRNSMLSECLFYGFECLVTLLAVHFALIYMVTNYINKGYILNWTVLETVASNIVEDT